MSIYQILQELNQENGSNYKMAVLRKYKDNELLKWVLKMAYDKVSYTFGIRKMLPVTENKGSFDLEYGLSFLEQMLNTRTVTGNEALEQLKQVMTELSANDADVIAKVIGRDLKINMGQSSINKVFPKLIVKPPYQRCDIGTEKNIKKNMDFTKGVYSQLKMDGSYRSCLVDGEQVTFMSRSGNEDFFPKLKEEVLALKIDRPVVFLGELTIDGVTDRAEGNGLIISLSKGSKSHDPDEINENVRFTIWDMVDAQEYNQKKGTSKYFDRFKELTFLVDPAKCNRISVVETRVVNSMKEAYEHFQEVTARGDEGTVIKSQNMTWKDGTSREALKIKLAFSVDVRITGFKEGKPGTKREKTFGAIEFQTDDGLIVGSTSGFTEAQLEDFNTRRDELIGVVMEVEANDLTKGRNNNHFALSHPRFIEIRTDKNTTDTLNRAQESLRMSMSL